MNTEKLIKELQRIRYCLEDMRNCEDSFEMIDISLDLASDIAAIEEELDDCAE